MTIYTYTLGLPRWLSGKGSACQCRRYRGCRRCEFDAWIGKIPWRRKWQPISVFFPGISHGQRSLVNLQSMGSQRVRHDSDWAHMHTHIYIHIHTHKTNIYMNIYSCEIYMWSKVRVAQLCPTLWDSMDYTVHGILQARILEWIAFPFSKGSSQPRDWTQVIAMKAPNPSN